MNEDTINTSNTDNVGYAHCEYYFDTGEVKDGVFIADVEGCALCWKPSKCKGNQGVCDYPHHLHKVNGLWEI